jgi:hypothetical protein
LAIRTLRRALYASKSFILILTLPLALADADESCRESIVDVAKL